MLVPSASLLLEQCCKVMMSVLVHGKLKYDMVLLYKHTETLLDCVKINQQSIRVYYVTVLISQVDNVRLL